MLRRWPGHKARGEGWCTDCDASAEGAVPSDDERDIGDVGCVGEGDTFQHRRCDSGPRVLLVDGEDVGEVRMYNGTGGVHLPRGGCCTGGGQGRPEQTDCGKRCLHRGLDGVVHRRLPLDRRAERSLVRSLSCPRRARQCEQLARAQRCGLLAKLGCLGA